jgi:hypothetical protein
MLEARRGGWWDANKIGLCSTTYFGSRGLSNGGDRFRWRESLLSRRPEAATYFY